MSSVPFEQTLLVLRRESGSGRYFVVGILLFLLAIWVVAAGWFVLPVQLASSDGGLVSSGASARLLSPSSQRIKAVSVTLGQQVAAGDTLLEFDTQALVLDLESTELQLEQQRLQQVSVREQGEGLRAQWLDQQRSAQQELERLRSKVAQAQSKIGYARKAEALYGQLRTERRIDKLQYEQAAATLAQEQLELGAVNATLAKTQAELELADSQNNAQQAQLEERQALLAQQGADLARVRDQLLLQVERSTLLAPFAGTVGALAESGEGSVLPLDSWVLTLLPMQAPEFKARFPVRNAGGRIAPGQPAQIELYALPWVEHGTLSAEVLRVGQVPNGDHIEVVFALQTLAPQSALFEQLQQGLQGRVRVEVGALTLAQRFMRLLSLSPEPSI